MSHDTVTSLRSLSRDEVAEVNCPLDLINHACLLSFEVAMLMPGKLSWLALLIEEQKVFPPSRTRYVRNERSSHPAAQLTTLDLAECLQPPPDKVIDPLDADLSSLSLSDSSIDSQSAASRRRSRWPQLVHRMPPSVCQIDCRESVLHLTRDGWSRRFVVVDPR